RHDTPERSVLLKQAGIDTGAMSEVTLARLAMIGDCFSERAEKAERSELPYSLQLPVQYSEGAKETASVEGLNTIRLSDVQAREVDWIWPQRIPLGKFTLLSGDPGLGKTWLVLDIIARLTTGRDFPDGTRPSYYPPPDLPSPEEEHPGCGYYHGGD